MTDDINMDDEFEAELDDQHIEAVDIEFGNEATGPLTHDSLNGVEVRLVYVTPDLANTWLNQMSKQQRSMSPETSDSYAADMTSGAFLFVGDPIRFDVTGDVVDGQHRLNAIVESGIPQVMSVVTGLPEFAMEFVDQGRRRSFADRLKMRKLPNVAALAAVVSTSWWWDQGNYGKRALPRLPGRANVYIKPSHAQLWQTYQGLMAAGNDPTAAIRRASNIKASLNTPAQIRPLAFANVLFTRCDPYQRDEFWDRVMDKISGDERNVSPTFAPNALRNRLTARVDVSKRPTTGEEWLHMIIRTWNAWQGGEELLTVKAPPLLNRTPGSWAYPVGVPDTAK